MATPQLSPPEQRAGLRSAAGLAAQHASLHRGAVIGRIVQRMGADVPAWLAEAAGNRAVGWDAELDAFEAEAAVLLPLRGLDRCDARLLVGAGLIEDDIRFGALFAELQDPLPARRPCLGLLADPDESQADLHERAQALANRGLLEIHNLDGPRAEWVLRLPIAIWDLLYRGRIVPATLTFRPADSFPELAEVRLSGELAVAARRLPALVRTGDISAVVLRGMAGSGRLTLLGAVARAVGQPVLVHDGVPGDAGWRLLAPLCELGDAFPVMLAAPGPGETMHLPGMPALARPLGLVLGRSGGLSGPMTERAVGFVLGPCIAEDRRDLWATSTAVSPVDAEQIVQSFLLTPGHIRRAGQLAQATAAADGRALVTVADVQTATRALQRQTLETLATRLDPLTGAAPVLSATLLQRLEAFDGIVVITTNAGSRIDPAFLRRIDVTVDFVPPDADQRWQLWHRHLPDKHEVDPGLMQDVARRCVLTGAQIRNATLHALLLSLEWGSPVSHDDVTAALRREYRRIGASFPLAHLAG